MDCLDRGDEIWICSALEAIFNGIVTSSVLPLIQGIGLAETYLIQAGITLIGAG